MRYKVLDGGTDGPVIAEFDNVAEAVCFAEHCRRPVEILGRYNNGKLYYLSHLTNRDGSWVTGQWRRY